METQEHIIACIETLTVYDFYPSKEAAETNLPRVKDKYKADAEKMLEFSTHIPKSPTAIQPAYWLQQRERDLLQAEGMSVMTFDEYKTAEADRVLSVPILEITEEQFDEMLSVLPPLKWGSNRGVHSFFMSEFQSGSYTHQYAKIGDKYYSKIVDFRKPETWIQPTMISEATSESLPILP